MKRVTIFLLGIMSTLALAEQKRTLTVLGTTDTSQLFVARKMQTLLADSFQKANLFTVSTHASSPSGYTEEALQPLFKETGAELLSFVYVDRDRAAIFLFDQNRPGKYIATSETLSGSPTNRLTETWMESQFNKAFSELMRQYSVAAFEAVPAQQNEEEQTKELSREERGRRLFNELAKIQDGSSYLGASIGMVQFSTQGNSASTVNLGVYGGMKLFHRLRAELGADVFSYLLLNGDLRFQLPILEGYVSLSVGVSGSYMAATVTQNRGFNPTLFQPGSFFFGPSLTLDVPLLGATVRGDIKLLMGPGTLLVGTYGLAYTL
ncbi:hypothetical protein K2X33_15440 [bacterium]|nr:hypothetical protein [bacterium]